MPAPSSCTIEIQENRLAERLLVATYALTTLLSALLLFEVQPIISKFILPWFGGSPAVWTTAMVFFQTLLFAGYAYAHLTTRFLGPRWQAAVHVGLLVGAVAMLPIAPSASWKVAADAAPTWHILCLLAVSVGLPYFALSATGPLVQAWFCRSLAGRSPYRLYALSNFGSLVALVGYPFYVERRFDVGRQAWLWGLGFIGFALLCGAGAIVAAAVARRKGAGAGNGAAHSEDDAPAPLPSWRDRLAWLGLPALASVMLLATTNHICQDVAVIPFLWVAPLALYLLSFIISFDHASWYWRRPYAAAALLSLAGLIVVEQLITGGSGLAFRFWQELALHLAALFSLCMVCHGELFRRRPDPRHLTSYYLMIAAGGEAGGMFVSLLAPHLFTTFFEWRIALVVGLLTSAWVWLDGQAQSFFRRRFAHDRHGGLADLRRSELCAAAPRRRRVGLGTQFFWRRLGRRAACRRSRPAYPRFLQRPHRARAGVHGCRSAPRADRLLRPHRRRGPGDRRTGRSAAVADRGRWVGSRHDRHLCPAGRHDPFL